MGLNVMRLTRSKAQISEKNIIQVVSYLSNINSNKTAMECYVFPIFAWGKIFNCNPLSLLLLFFCSLALEKLACCCCPEQSEGPQKGWLFQEG